MNDNQFINFIADNFNCSKLAARAIVTIFIESIYLAIIEGKNIDINNFGKFKISNIPERKTYSYKIGKNIHYKEQHRLSFLPANQLKLALK